MTILLLSKVSIYLPVPIFIPFSFAAAAAEKFVLDAAAAEMSSMLGIDFEKPAGGAN